MQKPLPSPTDLYTGSIGLNNKLAPQELPFSLDGGVSALEQASDVLISKGGKISSRPKNTLKVAGNFHSMYRIDESTFYVVEDRTSDAALFLATFSSSGEISLTGIRSGLDKEKVSYFYLTGEIYYSNGLQRGVLKHTESSAWPVNQWTGPETSATMLVLPIGKHIEIFNGRALSVVGDELFFSEFGLPGLINAVKNRHRFESDIRLIKSVKTGIFVSDEKAIYFLEGRDPNKWNLDQVANYPALEYSDLQNLIDPSFFGIESQKLSCLFGTVQGPVIGQPDGSITNLINKNVTMPSCSNKTGATMVIDETLILQTGEI